MQKPNNYENTKAIGEYETLDAGPYVCKVVDVAEMKSRSGKDMIKIALEVTEGEHAGIFKRKYDEDTRAEKKWPCVMYQLTENKDGDCSRGLKTFLSCLESDNSGFEVVWGDGFCKNIKNRAIGINFRREEFKTQQGDYKWTTKPYMFCEISKIRDGKVNAPKELPIDHGVQAAIPDSMQSIDEDVPF